MKEQIKSPDKELSNEEIANLSDEEFKTLVIRTLREVIEYSKNIREEMKAILSEVKENKQRTSSEGKETRTQINGLEQKEERNFNQNRMEKQEFKKKMRGLGTSRTTLNIPTSES